MTRKVIIDTDPGLDDAIAILFALKHPDLDVIGITTVAGNIGLETTTHNALRLLALSGQSVPVHAGAAAPLSRYSADEQGIHGADGLGGVTLPEPSHPASKETAHQALIRLLSEAPKGSIDILALAPLTNIARLISEAPEAAARIGRIIAMGGAINEKGNVGPRSEFNIAHDPEAADIVFSSGLPITLIPLDVTRKVRANKDYLDRLGALGSTEAIACRDLILAYFKGTEGRESRPLHDPCVPLLALYPELFTTESMALSVDLSTDEHAGDLKPGTCSIDVAMGVDAEGVLARLAEALGQS